MEYNSVKLIKKGLYDKLKGDGYIVIQDIGKYNLPISTMHCMIASVWDGFFSFQEAYYYSPTIQIGEYEKGIFITCKMFDQILHAEDKKEVDEILKDHEEKIIANYINKFGMNCKLYSYIGDEVVAWKEFDMRAATQEEDKKLFKEALKCTRREGVDKFLEWLEKETDFYSAPASSHENYHGCYIGGLLHHSVNVYRILDSKINESEFWSSKISEEARTFHSIEIISLLHDICKVNLYKPQYQTETSKTNAYGDIIYTSYTDTSRIVGYKIEDDYPFGHGEKSVDIISNFITLTKEESLAIRWHMGPYTGESDWKYMKAAWKMYPIGLALFEADMEDAYFSK